MKLQGNVTDDARVSFAPKESDGALGYEILVPVPRDKVNESLSDDEGLTAQAIGHCVKRLGFSAKRSLHGGRRAIVYNEVTKGWAITFKDAHGNSLEPSPLASEWTGARPKKILGPSPALWVFDNH